MPSRAILLALLAVGAPALAEPPPCVTVDIAGHRADATACAAERLQHATRLAQQRADAAPPHDLPDARSAAVRIGTASAAASGQRLGGDLGGATRLPVRPAPALTAAAAPWGRTP